MKYLSYLKVFFICCMVLTTTACAKTAHSGSDMKFEFPSITSSQPTSEANGIFMEGRTVRMGSKSGSANSGNFGPSFEFDKLR